MKYARPTEKAESSVTLAGAPIIGNLLNRKNTVRAEVLCRLLSGEQMTGMNGVFEASTTRLAAVVEALSKQYGWCILSRDKAAGCNDGRVSRVREYRLSDATRASAMAAGAADWCREVRAARLKRRADAALAKCRAAAINAARAAQHPGQFSLFEGPNHG
jgi:hypothetical protein